MGLENIMTGFGLGLSSSLDPDRSDVKYNAGSKSEIKASEYVAESVGHIASKALLTAGAIAAAIVTPWALAIPAYIAINNIASKYGGKAEAEGVEESKMSIKDSIKNGYDDGLRTFSQDAYNEGACPFNDDKNPSNVGGMAGKLLGSVAGSAASALSLGIVPAIRGYKEIQKRESQRQVAESTSVEPENNNNNHNCVDVTATDVEDGIGTKQNNSNFSIMATNNVTPTNNAIYTDSASQNKPNMIAIENKDFSNTYISSNENKTKGNVILAPEEAKNTRINLSAKMEKSVYTLEENLVAPEIKNGDLSNISADEAPIYFNGATNKDSSKVTATKGKDFADTYIAGEKAQIANDDTVLYSEATKKPSEQKTYRGLENITKTDIPQQKTPNKPQNTIYQKDNIEDIFKSNYNAYTGVKNKLKELRQKKKVEEVLNEGRDLKKITELESEIRTERNKIGKLRHNWTTSAAVYEGIIPEAKHIAEYDDWRIRGENKAEFDKYLSTFKHEDIPFNIKNYDPNGDFESQIESQLIESENRLAPIKEEEFRIREELKSIDEFLPLREFKEDEADRLEKMGIRIDSARAKEEMILNGFNPEKIRIKYAGFDKFNIRTYRYYTKDAHGEWEEKREIPRVETIDPNANEFNSHF